jgi:predicted GIY-YIG superfamily endonuclease
MTKPSPSGLVNQFRQQTLYRFWQNDVLLYVGISQSFLSRMDQHDTTKQWFGYTTHITLEHHATRRLVETAEKNAIKTEQPIFNVVHNKVARKDKTRVVKLETLLPADYFYELPANCNERKKFLDSLKSPKGGYTRLTLEKLRVPYPAPKGWRSQLIDRGFLGRVQPTTK